MFSENNLHDTTPSFIDKHFLHHVCKLHKFLYWLKQAPHAWYDWLWESLLDLGIVTSPHDNFLFIRSTGGTFTVILNHVDDILLRGNSPQFCNSLIASLGKDFPRKDLRPAHYFLGLELTPTSNGLFICQSKYITDLLSRANMEGCKHCSSLIRNGLNKWWSPFQCHWIQIPHRHRTISYLVQTEDILRRQPSMLVSSTTLDSSSHGCQTDPPLSQRNNHSWPHLQTRFSSKSSLLWRRLGQLDYWSSVYNRILCLSWSKSDIVVCQKVTNSCSQLCRDRVSLLALTSAEICWLLYMLHDLQIPISSALVVHCDNINAMLLLTT